VQAKERPSQIGQKLFSLAYFFDVTVGHNHPL
jgi:hypothetical protein